MSYDAAGNLARIERGADGGESTEETYQIGDYNEVLRVRTGDGQDAARPDLTFEYDAAGRVRRATIGKRTATVQYDSLDRAARSSRLPSRRVFGTMESIVYSRPRSTESRRIVAYSPSRKTFEVRVDALAADAVLLTSLHARMVPLARDASPNPAPFAPRQAQQQPVYPARVVGRSFCQVCKR